jgi:hypothetical protein
MIETMSIPETRAEFERRMNLVKEQMRQNKMRFLPQAMKGVDGLKRVRYLPNGRIDLLSINDSARLHANTLNQFQDRDFGDLSEQEPRGEGINK